MEMFPACHAQLSWKKTSPKSHYIPPVREHKLWGKSKQSMFQLPLMSVEWFLFWKCFWLELAQLHMPGCFCIKHQFPKYPGFVHPFEMCEMLLSFNRTTIWKSEGAVIPNDMGTVKSVASGDIKPCLCSGLPACAVISWMDVGTLGVGIAAVFRNSNTFCH